MTRATVSHQLHLVTKSSLESAWVSNDHVSIQAVVLKIICKKLLISFPLKIISFLQLHIAQNSAHAPIQICPPIFKSTPCSHVPNNVFMLIGGFTLKAIWRVRQSSLANEKSRKRSWIVSSWWQRQHQELLTHLHFTRSSFVNITPLCTNHMKILIISRTIIFQMCTDLKIGLESNRSKYINFTDKLTFLDSFQWLVFGWAESWTSINLRTKCSQEFHHSPTRDLLNCILRGNDCSTVATQAFLRYTILYKVGYWMAKGISPNYTSSYNLVVFHCQ